MDETPERSYRQEFIVLSARFDHLVVPVAMDGSTAFLSIAFFCEYLGIQKRVQADALKADRRFPSPDVLREAPFKTGSAGYRTQLAIRRDKFNLWILGIDHTRIKPERRGMLEALQEEVSQLTDRLIFGARVVPLEGRGVVEVTGMRVYRFPCEDCGAWHVLRDDGNGHVEVMRDVERGEG